MLTVAEHSTFQYTCDKPATLFKAKLRQVSSTLRKIAFDD